MVQEHSLDSRQRGERKAMPPKRLQESNRRDQDNDDGTYIYSGKDQKHFPVDEATSEDEDQRERRGRTKIERWTSRKDREMPDTVDDDERRHRRHHGSQGPGLDVEVTPNTTQEQIGGRRKV